MAEWSACVRGDPAPCSDLGLGQTINVDNFQSSFNAEKLLTCCPNCQVTQILEISVNAAPEGSITHQGSCITAARSIDKIRLSH